MAERANPRPDRRTLYASYGAGFFAQGIVPMTTLILPLWALDLGATVLEIGIAAGSRSALSLLFSIHGGVVMDRIGTRRVMLACGVLAVAMAPLHPLLPWVAALVVLQLPTGFAHAIYWVGVQIQINHLTRGDHGYVGRFTAFSTAGNFIAPPIAGVAWDFGGAWTAYGVITAWAVAMLISCLLIPPGAPGDEQARTPIRRTDLVPRMGDYRTAIGLARDPAVAFTICCSAFAGILFAMKNSFYPVYLESLSMSGTVIGLLIGAASLVGAPSALVIGPVTRRVRPRYFIMAVLIVATLGLTATPLARSFWPLLVLVCIYGIGIGMVFPLLISFLSRAIEPSQQGMSVGLRVTANRFAALVIPIVMGAIAQNFSIAASFYVLGVAVLLGIAVIIYVTRHTKSFSTHGET